MGCVRGVIITMLSADSGDSAFYGEYGRAAGPTLWPSKRDVGFAEGWHRHVGQVVEPGRYFVGLPPAGGGGGGRLSPSGGV